MDNNNLFNKNMFSTKYYNYIRENHIYVQDSDFYQPCDDRKLESYIEDIDGGDNFEDYCQYIFDLYEEEGYYEN